MFSFIFFPEFFFFPAPKCFLSLIQGSSPLTLREKQLNKHLLSLLCKRLLLFFFFFKIAKQVKIFRFGGGGGRGAKETKGFRTKDREGIEMNIERAILFVPCTFGKLKACWSSRNTPYIYMPIYIYISSPPSVKWGGPIPGSRIGFNPNTFHKKKYKRAKHKIHVLRNLWLEHGDVNSPLVFIQRRQPLARITAPLGFASP